MKKGLIPYIKGGLPRGAVLSTDTTREDMYRVCAGHSVRC